jgi:hypothetical protein
MEGFARLIVEVALWGIVWLIAIVVAIAFSNRLNGILAKAVLILTTIGSFPGYIALFFANQQYQLDSTKRQNMAIEQTEATHYKELCAKPQQLSVLKTLKLSEAADIRIKEARTLYPLKIMEWGHERCWTKVPPHACTLAKIANVQWEHKSTGSWCEVPSPPKDCHLMWNFAVPTQTRTDIANLTPATVTIETSRGERISPLIERFRVTIYKEDDPSMLLGETIVYRKSSFGFNKDFEPRHCPARDVAIGKLLDSVLIVGG